MPENFELLDTGQIIQIHQQVHDRLTSDDGECHELRVQHDSLAAEIVKRGLLHDTEIVCSEIETNAPNFRHGFTDDVCTNCAFGQLFPFCNLYKFDYLRGYTCDSFRYFEILELEPPHGFLIANGKQTAIARNEPLDKKMSQAYVIVSGGECFGIAVLSDPVQMKTKQFDDEEWTEQHRITQRERRQWWPDNDMFYVYRFEKWCPYEGIKLYKNGKVIDEPKLTAKQWQIISKAKELPKQITLLDDAVSITDKQEFSIFPGAQCDQLKAVLAATYEIDVKEANEQWNEIIPIYSLALVRNPRMRVSKKNLIAEGEKEEKQETEEKQEEVEIVPYGIVKREDEFCVINTDTEEIQACHETEEEAEAQLAALRINVEAEESESAVHSDKPRKRKPRKKALITKIGNKKFITESGDVQVEIDYEKEADLPEISEKPKKATFIENLKSLSKSITSFLKSTEIEENKGSLFVNEVGIAQKEVNGELWHFTYSTNAFEDREGEIFSTKSLENYVANNEANDNKGYFNLWHINAEDGNFNTDFAKKEWQGVIGRFLVEAGSYLDNEKGKIAKEFFKQFGDRHPEIAPEGWGCSPEFRYLPEERETGTYETIWITRTSTLPKFAAANVWTETRQQKAGNKMALSEQQIKAAVEVFGDDFVTAMIKEAESKTVELENAGVAHKDKEQEESKPQEIQLNMEDLAQEVGKQLSVNFTPIAEAMTTMTDSLKSLEERLEKIEETKQVKDKTETPRFIFNMKRASEQEDTIVTEDDGLKDRKPQEAKVGSGDAWSQIFNK